MDNQNQPQNQIQFNSEKITELKDKRNQEVQAKFRTRLTVRDRLRKLGEKPFLQGRRKFVWLGVVVLVAAVGTFGVVWLVNRDGADDNTAGGEFSEEWYQELDDEIYAALENRELMGVLEKVDAAIAEARVENNTDALWRLHGEKTRMLGANQEYDEALAAYDDMISDLGESTLIYRSIGQMYINMGDPRTALENYKKTLELMTEDDEDYSYMQRLISELEASCG